MTSQKAKATLDALEQTEIFDDWLSNHQGLLFKVVHSYAFTSHDQDDLFQETLLRVWTSIPNFRSESSSSTWLYRIAICTAMDWSKKKRRHAAREKPLSNVEAKLTRRPSNAQLDWLYEQMAKLDEVERSLMLLWLDGFTYREIAAFNKPAN